MVGCKQAKCLVIAFLCCVSLGFSQSKRAAESRDTSFQAPRRTKTSNCTVRDGLPDRACTPGAVLFTDADVVCKMRTSALRSINRAQLRETVFASYGIALPVPVGAYELDHLIPLELGGSDTVDNLWPQAAVPSPGYHEKDRVETSPRPGL